MELVATGMTSRCACSMRVGESSRHDDRTVESPEQMISEKA